MHVDIAQTISNHNIMLTGFKLYMTKHFMNSLKKCVQLLFALKILTRVGKIRSQINIT